MQKAVLDSWKTKLPSQIKNPVTKCHPSPKTPNKNDSPKPTTPKHKIQRHFIVGIQANMEKHPSNTITSNLFSRIGNQSLLMKLRK